METTNTTKDNRVNEVGTFCASNKWTNRGRDGRFVTSEHEAMLDTVWNDEAEVAHSTPNCGSAHGTCTEAPRSEAGWLCSKCVDVDLGLGELWFRPAKSGTCVCGQCAMEKDVKKFPTFTTGSRKGQRYNVCRACHEDKRSAWF